MFKNKGFSAIAIIIILAVLAVGGYAVWKKQTVTPPSALPEGEGTTTSPLGGGSEGVESWKTYRNEKYGFEFKYPNEWQVDDNPFPDWPPKATVTVSRDGYVIYFTEGGGGRWKAVAIDEYTPIQLVDGRKVWRSTLPENMLGEDIFFELGVITPSPKVSPGYNGDFESKIIFNGKARSIAYNLPPTATSQNMNYDVGTIQLMDKIVSTFRFIMIR